MGDKELKSYNVVLRSREKTNFEIGFEVSAHTEKEGKEKALKRVTTEFSEQSQPDQWEFVKFSIVRQMLLF